jgi:Ca2+-binding EF-hand superfamily protein
MQSKKIYEKKGSTGVITYSRYLINRLIKKNLVPANVFTKTFNFFDRNKGYIIAEDVHYVASLNGMNVELENIKELFIKAGYQTSIQFEDFRKSLLD